MTELNVKIEIRKTGIQRKIKKKSCLSEFSQIQSINGAKTPTRGLFVQGI